MPKPSNTKASKRAQPKLLKKLADLEPDARNANRGTERGLGMLDHSLREYGAGRSILVDRLGRTIAGNKTLERAAELGLEIEVVRTKGDRLVVVQREDLDLDEPRARELAIADNRVGQVDLEWDANVLKALADDGVDLSQFFLKDELTDLLSKGEPVAGHTDPDDVPPERATDIKAGDLFELGKHRLLCGDSTKAEDVARVMGGERAALFATDPPYAVGYRGGSHPATKANKGASNRDKDWSSSYEEVSTEGDGREFYVAFVRSALDVAIAPTAAWYCWHASRRQAMLESVWNDCGAFVHQQIIWVKTRAVLTYSIYMWAHEPCLFGWVKGNKPFVQRKHEHYPSTIWEVPNSEIESDDHPTSKPVRLFSLPIEMHTLPGDVCYEPFSGSGTQIIAAEQLDRRCFACEISPPFVQVAIDRWEQFTGKKAVKVV